jgi:hypothetical protein
MDVLSSIQSRLVDVEEILPQIIDGVLQERAYDVNVTKEDFALEMQ